MRYIVIEMFEPFEINVFSLSDALEEFAQNEVERAIQIWQHSISHKKWQEWAGYPQDISMAELKPWIINKAIDQGIIEETWGVN